MQHGVTKSTKTHEGEWRRASAYRKLAARARARVVFGEVMAPGPERLDSKADRIKRGLRRMLKG